LYQGVAYKLEAPETGRQVLSVDDRNSGQSKNHAQRQINFREGKFRGVKGHVIEWESL